MLEVTASTPVPAAPARAWELVCDTARYPDWVVGTDEVTRTDGPARQGSTYDERNTLLGPWKASSSWRVVEDDPPRRQVHVSHDLPLAKEFTVIMELTPESDGCRLTVTLRGEPKGPLGGLVARLMRPAVERNNRATVRRFAELARAAQ